MTGTAKGIGSGTAASLAKPINEQNKGGFFAGLSYLLEKAGLGFAGALEGLVDYTVGGIAELTGNHDYAESVIANDWLDYSHADEWFVPDDGWKLAGDVAAGIGNSVPGLAANVGIGIATGGMSVVAQAALAGTTTFLTSGLSAAGNSVKDAYRETGKLGAEEWAYGTGAGALEGTVEALGDTVFGLGFGAAKKAAIEIFGKNTAKTIAREGIFKTMAKGFVGEAGEEAISAYFEPYIKRATYDPNAEDASPQEIAYSALVGGLSGMLMSGAAGGANALVNVKHGADIENRGEIQRILDRSEQIAKAETSVKTESDAFRAVDGALREFKASVETHPSDTLTMKQKMLLGYLDRANTVAAFQPYFWKEATNILSNAEGVAEAINRFYSDSTSGEKIHITAQELLKDIDMSSPQAYRKSIVKALKTNQKLRTLAVLRATGRLTMNTEKYTDALLAGENIAVSQEGFNTFLEHAKPHQLKSVADALGIDDLSAETTETLRTRIGEYRERVGEDYYKASEHAIQAFSSVGKEDARGKLPHMVRGKNDGVRRYRVGDNDIGILQEGKEYRFYDYNEKGLSRPMKYSEAQKVLTAWREEAENPERRNVTGRARENSFTREARLALSKSKVEKLKYDPKEKSPQQSMTDESASPAPLGDVENESIITRSKEKNNPSAEKDSKNLKKQGTTRQNSSKDAGATMIPMRAEVEKIAIKHVPEYGRLNAPDRQAVRMTIRQAMAANLSEEIVTLSARVAAHSGLTVVFLPGIPGDGMNIGNTVYLSPRSSETRLRGKLLMHELDHILVRQKNGNRLIAEALKNIDPEKRKEVIKQYKDSGIYDHLSAEEKRNALEDEVASAYAEEIASDPKIWDYILSEKPTTKERVLSFFRRAARDYAFDEKMSAEAKRYLKQFKQLFDTLSEQNATYGGAALGGARFALPDTVEEDVVDRYGKTYRWSETGYILKDGTRLDLFGRKDGAPGGYRTMDHRDIFEDISEGSGTNAMIEFMSRGNIRVSPEMPGINLQTEPTVKQYEQIADLVERLGWKEKSFLVDFDNKNGETVDTLDYEGNVSARKVVSDIQYYFKEGKTPQVSDLAKFRYALSENSENASRYTYDALIAKKDMKVTALPKTVPTTEDGKIDRKAIVALGRMNARSQKNPHNTDTSVYVYVDDIGRDVLLSKEGMQHGIARSKESALAVTRIGDVLKGSIAVNELNGSTTRKTEMSYVLLGACRDGENLYVVRSVVSRIENDVTEMDVYRLGAVKSKKTETPTPALGGTAVTEQSSLISSESPAISIPDFLEKVKTLPLANEIFSQDVLKKLGIKRSVGTLSDSIRFALPKNSDAYSEEDANTLANYSEKEYNSFGWARVAEALSHAELDDLYAKIQERSSLYTFRRSKNGEFIIEVNNKPHTTLDVDNVFVFVKGTTKAFTIARVVRFDVQTETEMDSIRRTLYEGRTCNDTYIRLNEEKGLAREYRRENSQSFAEYSKERAERRSGNGETSRGDDRNHRRSEKYRSGYYIHIGEDGEITETFGNKNKVTRRFALPEDGEFTFSKGEDGSLHVSRNFMSYRDDPAYVRQATDISREKYYSKKELEAAVNSAVDEIVQFNDERSSLKGKIKGKTKSAVVNYLWQKFNKSASEEDLRKSATDIADYIIDHTMVEEIYNDARYTDNDIEHAEAALTVLRGFMHNMNLQALRGEIKYKYDKKANGVFLTWGKKEGGITADVAVMALRDAGLQIEVADAEADCFFNILDLYERSREILRDKAFSEKLKAFGSEEEIAAMRDEIAKKILSIRDLEGKKTQYGKLVEEYTEKVRSLKQKSEDTIHSLKRENAENIRSLKQELRDERQIPPLENRVIKKIQGVKDWKSGVFQNATQYRPKILLQTIGKLSSIVANGNIRDGAVRKVMRDLYLWYSSENTRNMLEGTGRYNAEVAGMLSALAEDARPLTAAEENDLAGVLTLYRQLTGISLDLEGTSKKEAAATLRDFYTRKNIGDAYSAETKQLLSRMAKDSTLTAAELRELGDVVDYFKHFVENFNRVFRDGKWQDAAPIAEGMIHIAETAETANYGIFYRLMQSNVVSKYRETFAEPMTVAKYADGHDDNGFFTRVVTDLREAAIKQSIIDHDLRQRLEEFCEKKENRKWLKRAQKETVTYNNETLTKREAIQLYMTFHRDIATAGLLLSGFDIRRESGTLTVKPIADASLTAEQLETLTKKCIADLKAQFSTSDLEFISVAEEIYKDCRELKRETDMLRNGFSNVTEGYYVPVVRIGGAKSFDSDFFGEGVSVNRQSFNKSTVKGAKAKLVISPVDEVLSRHIEGISRYAAFGPVLDTMDMLWNFDIGGNPNNPTSMRTVAEKSWRGGEKYLTKLKQDCKGIGRDGKLPFVQKLIGKYATAVLALNPKVLASQLSSLIASTSILDYTSLLRGITMSGKDVDVYCKLAQVRNYDKTAYRAQAVTDKIGSVGEVLMEPIGKVDRFVVKKLFGACQVQVEKEGGAKIGSVENKQAAGKLLERVILETQQNAYATERSEAMRSGNDFLRLTTLFSADSMKVFDRILDSWGEWSVLSAKIKAEKDRKVLAELKARRKQTRKHFAKAAGALLASGIYMALAAEFFRWFFGQRDEDDDLVVDLVHGTIGNLFGGLPLIKDVMSFITDGYEMSAPTYDMINNAMDATKTAVTVMPKIIDGTAEKQEAAKATRNFIYAASQLLGVPTKNAYKLFYGVTSKVSKKAGYVLDDLFYRQNYRRDLAEAIVNEDDEMTDLLLSMIARDSTGTDAGTEWKGATGALLKSRSRRMVEDETKEGTDAKSAVSKVMKDLLNAGQNPLPRSIGDTITHDGDEYELTKENKALFKKIYGESSDVLERMVTTPAFAALDTEEKASAIRYVYDAYDRKAKESVLDTEADVRTIAAKMTDVGTLALVKAKISSFEAERDKNGKVIGGTKKKKVLRYLSSLGLSVGEALFLLYLNGYAIGDGEIRGMSETTAKKKLLRYIQSSNLTPEERVAVAEACGFTVKGGKVLLPAS